MPVYHSKTNNISDWTQADLDAQIALGNFPPGTLLADIVLPSDWNDSHNLSSVTLSDFPLLSINVDGKSVTGDGNTVALESHTYYDQTQSSSYALQDSDNDRVFDDTVGGCIYSLTELTKFPFSATFVNINEGEISIDVTGCNIYIGGVNYTTITSINTVKKGSSLKIRIHLDPTKVYLEPFGKWDMVV